MNKFMTSVVVICFNMQPFAIKASFGLFQCLNLYREDSPQYYMVKDYDIKCWEGPHMKWTLAIGIPSLLLWIFILPGIMFNILRKNQNRLKHEKIAKKYAFLYLGYKKERYFWEFIIMIRKILLILAALLGIIYSNDFELYFSVMIAIIAYVLHVWNRPYEDHRLNTLESISLLSSEIVCFCAMYFKLITRASELDVIIMVFGFVGNAFFIIAFLKEFIRIKLKDIRRNKMAQRILNFVRLRLCCCIKGANFWKTLGVGVSSRGFAAHFIAQLQGPTLATEEAEAEVDAAEPIASENYMSELESNKAASSEKVKPSTFKPKGFAGQLQLVKLNTEEADDENGSEPATKKASEVGRKLPNFEPRGLGGGHFTPTATQRLMTLNTEDIELNSASDIGTNKACDSLKFEPKGVTSYFGQTAKIARLNTGNSETHSPFNFENNSKMSESSKIQRFETKGFSSHFAQTTKLPRTNNEEGEITLSEEGTHKVSELSRINTLEPKGFAQKFAATTKLIRVDTEEGEINLNSPQETGRGSESAKVKKTKHRGFSAQFMTQPKFTPLKTEEVDLNSASPLASNRGTERLSLKPSDNTSE